MAESFLNGFGFGNGFGNGAGAGTGAGSFLSSLPDGFGFGYGPSPAPVPSAPAVTGAGAAFVSAAVATPQTVLALPAATSTVQSFPDESGSGLNFTNVSVTETDVGSVAPFLSAGPSYGLDPFAGGLDWSGVSAGALAPGSSLSLDFGYDVATASPAEAITSLGLAITPDTTMAAGVTLTAVETVYNAGNQVVGQISVDLTDPTAPPLTATDLPLTAAQQDLHVDVQLTASLSSGAASGTVVGFSDIQQTFGEAPVTSLGTIAVDKQVSLDGVHWQDVGAGNLAGVTVLAGDTVYERVVVSNTGSVALSGVAVSDVNGVPGFTFGGAGSTSLGAGQSITSDIGTVAAAAGSQIDTATATGTFVVNGATLTTTASDQANYTGVTPSITIDKQVSVNGTTWQDVGSGTLNDPTVLAGDAVYERVILVNTGSIAIDNATATDTTGAGSLPDFTFGGAGSVSLGAGQTVVSDVSTLVAQSGYQTDTATVTGTATDTVNTGTVTASDQGDYTGVSGSISIDKQISVNGTTWQDVGDGVLNGPTVAAGSTLYERVLVTDTGPLAISGATVTDVNGPADFTFSGSLSTSIAVGQTVTSDVATVVAQAGYQVDTATVTGTVTDSVNTGIVTASDQADYTGTVVATGTPGISVLKVPGSVVVCAGGSETYTFYVTNTGATALTGVTIEDNIGTASKPDDVTPTAVTSGGYNVGDTNHDGVLNPGETWEYTETVTLSGAAASGGSGSSQPGSGSTCDPGSNDGNWFGSKGSTQYGVSGNSQYEANGNGCGSGPGAKPSAPSNDCGTGSNGSGGSTAPIYTGVADTVTVTATAPGGTKVSASDTKEVVVLGTSGGGSPGGSGSSGCGSNGQPGSGSGCNAGPGSNDGHSGSGSSGWGGYGSGGDQSGSGSGSNVGPGSNDGHSGSGASGWGGYGSGGDQSGSGSGCSTGPGSNDGHSGSGSSGWSGYGSGGDQSGSGSGCSTGPGSNDGHSGSGSSGWSGYGSGDGQSGSGSGCSTGPGSNNGHSGSGSSGWSGYGAGGDQSGSGSDCSTGPGSNDGHSGSGSSGWGGYGSGDGQSGSSNTGSGCGTDTSGTCGSGITLNGTAPSGNLQTLYGGPATLEFSYEPGSTVSLAAGSKALASVTGSNTNSMAFIELTNSSNPFAAGSQIYFEGAVTAGEDIFADATINPLTNTANASATSQFSTASGAELYGFVFTSQAAFLAKSAPVETMEYSTAGNHGMSLGDTIGSLKLVGYVGSTGGHLVS